ncbi:MAG TPA: methyltransferase domain-containing protein [Bradyrhizobium sp.]|nr:methyltransferase domain-containing protein [Bradyrhizobium sp.]
MPATTDYDTIAERYAADIDDRPWNALYERPTTLALLPAVDGKDVLDAGCGHGWYADWLWRHGARVVAVDRSAAMVALTQKRTAGRARVIQGDVTDLRSVLADQSFDLVLSSLVLHYEADLKSVFAESARLLRPGGSLVFSTHHPVHDQVSILDPGYLNAELIEEEWGWLGEKMRYYRRPLRDLTEPLADAGFVIERICEPTPSEELKLQDPKGYDRLSRLPAFIFVRARKGST